MVSGTWLFSQINLSFGKGDDMDGKRWDGMDAGCVFPDAAGRSRPRLYCVGMYIDM
jgi:hypothetical protein